MRVVLGQVSLSLRPLHMSDVHGEDEEDATFNFQGAETMIVHMRLEFTDTTMKRFKEVFGVKATRNAIKAQVTRDVKNALRSNTEDDAPPATKKSLKIKLRRS